MGQMAISCHCRIARVSREFDQGRISGCNTTPTTGDPAVRMLTKKNATRAVVGLGAVVALTACNGSFSGVGFMPSAGTTRGLGAYVNFRVLCTPGLDTEIDTGTVTGTLSYKDFSKRVVLTATATEVHPVSGNDAHCDGDLEQGHYSGTYVPAT